ncbi:cytochrome c biogenesis protein CcsA [Staphylococcus sp. EG-SA-6]|jgi:HemX protein|uniref:Cytochrome C assembly protein n=8 Tax=Staphylococcus haemolyticus TaxID=1283 RepID=A0A2T4SP52_STAHA|nr:MULTISPECIES: cytochrome c biogenesis protein [Staphylococcus]MBN4935013.1 cytochrome c biogenesis protein CcsA [Staphylococcus sp. EG-SA-6]AKC76002.1 hemA concentration negative effector hemX [Staphylococcus haemolyticus]AMW23601.1 cytochrome C assembly protein [Staphylococcus haemolyticus]AUV67281.1 cytochrome C assembly protein [Staphylococcus haemolyticus]AUV69661.1 cytochrome C assembly protein [Staphylococcus haemolyticus]
MQETLFIRFHEIILIIYLISILCYFIDFVKKSHKIRELGIYTLGIVWILQTISLSVYITSHNEIPLSSLFDVFFFLSWIIICIALVLNVVKVLSFSVFFLNVIGFILLMMNTFQPEHYSTNVQRIAVINELLLVHIGLAVLSYALFALAFVNSLLYIIQYRNLREKNFDQKYFRIGSVATLETVVFYSSLSGFIILILSVILGAQWGVYAIGHSIFADPKVVLSSIITIFYAIYLLSRINRWFKTIYLIYFNIMLFCLCMINLFFTTHFT